MAKKQVTRFIKLQIPAGKANPAPPVGPALGAAQVNIMQFCQQLNAATADKAGDIIPVEISVYEDRTFTFVCKTRSPERLWRSPARQGWPAHPGAAHQDRRDQDAGPQRQRSGCCQEDHRWHRSFDGRHHRRVALQFLAPRGERFVEGHMPATTTTTTRR